jgi:hypothetical protein
MAGPKVAQYSPMPVSYIKFLSALLSPGERIRDVNCECGAPGETVLTFVGETGTHIRITFTETGIARLRSCLT